MRVRSCAALAALVLVGGCAAPGTGMIRGTLRMPADVSARDAVVSVEPVADAVTASAHPASESRRLSTAPAASPHAAARVVERNHHFVPRVLAVAAGATVAFQNDDQVWHNAFSIAPARSFNLGPFGPGAVRRVTFPHAGIVQVFCGMDPSMAGFVVVLPGTPFARPDATGAFALDGLAPGRYDVRVWHPELGERTSVVQVASRRSTPVRIAY